MAGFTWPRTPSPLPSAGQSPALGGRSVARAPFLATLLSTVLAILLAVRAGTTQAQTVDLLVYPVVGVLEVTAQDEAQGPGVLLLERLELHSGLRLQRRAVPPVRALHALVTEPNTCAVGVPRLPERESQLQWIGVVASGALTLYGRPEETRQVRGVDDLRVAVIVARRDSAPAAWGRGHGLQIQEVRDTATGLRMLLSKRVDYWLANDLAVREELVRLAGTQPPRVIQQFGRTDTYLACHRDTPADTLARLHAALEQLRRDGDLTPLGVR